MCSSVNLNLKTKVIALLICYFSYTSPLCTILEIISKLKNIIKIVCYGFFIILCGCKPGEWDITLFEQKIAGTSKAIYKYNAWGGRDSHLFGYAILDTTQKFTIAGINKLPINKLNGIPSKFCINAIERNWPDKENGISFKPIDSYELADHGLNISILKYQRNGLREKGKGTIWFDYSEFKETRDSLEFYDLCNSKSVHHSRLDTLKVKKGNIIIGIANNLVTEIIVENLELSNDGTNTLISNRTYFLKPKKTTKSDEFSDYGIFKQKSTVPNNGYKP